jgi:transposase
VESNSGQKEIEKKKDNNESSLRSRVSQITTEQADDVPLLIGMMVKIGLPRVLDKHIPSHWKQRELSWGWTAVIWLAYVLSEGDHRKVAVREYVEKKKNVLECLTGQEVGGLDFTDDRLSILLKGFGNKEYWEQIEAELSENTIEAFELPKETVRCDATTVSGYHEAVEDGLFQFGNSKDDPSRPQIKIMTGSLDPLGMPLATDVVCGNRADDGLYAPIIDRIANILKKSGVLYVGDCKLGSFENRLHIKSLEGHYLCPLPQTGEVAKKMESWIEGGLEREEKAQLTDYTVKNEKGEEETKAKGYEIKRMQKGTVGEKEINWEERVLVVKSLQYAEAQARGLERRIEKAIEKIKVLTPERGRGKKQITSEEDLVKSAEGILKRQRVEGLVTYEYAKEVETQEKYVGRGRGSKNREKQIIEKVRYVITNVARCAEKIESEIRRFGWKVYVTDVSVRRLGFADAMRCYRKEYRIERIFNRLKSQLVISPMYVKRNEQIIGLTNLLTLGVRVLTLTEYIVRRSLEKTNDTLTGLHLENPKKETATPTSERLLRAFKGIHLTIIENPDGIIGHVTTLSQLQLNILQRLGLDAALYNDLAEFVEVRRC